MDIEKLVNHWEKILKKDNGFITFPDACRGVPKSKRELIDNSARTLTFNITK